MSSTVTRSGSSPESRGLDLAAALAQLRLDVGEPEQLVDARLVARSGGPSSPLTLATPCSLTEKPRAERALAELDVVLGRAGEVLEQVAEGLVGADPQVDLEAGVGEDAGRGVAAAAPLGGQSVRRERLGERARVVGGRDQVEVLAGLGPAPRRAGDLDPVRDARGPAGRRGSPRRPAGRGRAAAARRIPSSVQPLERGEDVLLGLRAEAPDPAKLLLLGAPRGAARGSRPRARRRSASRSSRRGPGPGSPRPASPGTSPSACRPPGSRPSRSAR